MSDTIFLRRRYHPITREQFEEDVFSKIYSESLTPTSLSPNPNGFSPPSPPSSILSPTSPDPSNGSVRADNNSSNAPAPFTSHRLAVLFAIFAVGTLVDLTQKSHLPQAKTYYYLAKAALSVENVLEEPSLIAIQALVSKTRYWYTKRDPLKNFLPRTTQ